MADSENKQNRFERLLEDSGLKIEYILDQGQFNNVTFRRRKMNPTEFTVYEILTLSKILRMPAQDLYDICTEEDI